jgi:sortase A
LVEQEPKGEAAEENGRRAAIPPDDPTLYLTVPRLGLYDNTVRNDRSEEAMGLGAIKLPGTDFPWQKGPTNTYIVCHRLGFPGTESFNQCLNLPSMQKGDEVILRDTNGTVYRYRVSEFLQVTPYDTWVTEPIAGKEMVSLQTCIEDLDDFFTMGPNWSARMVVRAFRVG